MVGDAKGDLRSGFPHLFPRVGPRVYVGALDDGGSIRVLTISRFEAGSMSTTDFTT